MYLLSALNEDVAIYCTLSDVSLEERVIKAHEGKTVIKYTFGKPAQPPNDLTPPETLNEIPSEMGAD